VAEIKWFMAFTVEPVNTLGYKNRQHGTGQGDPALKSRDEHVEIKFAGPNSLLSERAPESGRCFLPGCTTDSA